MGSLHILNTYKKKLTSQKIQGLFVVLVLLLTSFAYQVAVVNGANFTNASLSISDSRPSQGSVNYNFAFTTSVTTAIKQLDIQICTTATGTCNAPSGFSSGTPTIGSDNI